MECNNVKMLRIKNNLNQVEMAEIGKMSVPSYIKKKRTRKSRLHRRTKGYI